MSIGSQLRDSESRSGLPHSAQGFSGDDRLYQCLNVHPLNGSCEGSLIHSNHHVDHIPPIHRLPVELLAKIFRHYMQSVDYSQPSPSLRIRPASQTTPFHLGHVCYYWRSITLSMGDLWQSICICPPRIEHIPLIQLRLSHAGDHSLSIWLFQTDLPSDSELQATNDVLSLLVQRLHRWKAIEFRFSATVQQPLLDLPYGAAASLEAARIDMWNWDQASADNLWRALHSSPTICRPEWVNHYRDGPPNHAPWAQLTHIRLDGWFSSDVVLSVLQHCQSVVKLALHLAESPIMSRQISPFILTHLRTMRITTETELDSLFQSLLLPSLVSLGIRYPHSTRLSLTFGDLICRSQCQLSELILEPSGCDGFVDCLRIPALQSLVELRLCNLVTDQTIRLLSNLEDGEQLLPKLQAVKLPKCGTSDGVFSDMVVSRLPTLRTIRVDFCGDKHSYQRDLAMLDDMQKGGYDVEVDVR